MSTPAPDYRTLMTKALQEIKDLKSQLRRLEAERSAPIAIIGMACRFPGGANSPAAYWQLLRDGVDAISEIPHARWDVERFYDPDRNAPGKAYTRYGGFIDDIAGFDAGFFNISPREAESLDPHQRILLEVCWEALEYANLIPADLYGANAGVYIGVSSLDQILNRIGEVPLTEIGPYHGTGCALAPIAGRISYNFGFNGPSFVMDTACSSSLLSLHLAAEGLRRRECDLALAGGVHFLFHPGYFVAFSKASMLASDGRCKTFDAAANGYARGEGCGVVILKRMADALRDGDHILALLRGSAVNQDGASGGLTVPSGPSQEQVVRQALARSGIDPAQVSYIEAHGTGTPLGDPIEIGALANIFRQPLVVGSVKTNIGHLEASAGIAGVMKVILALQHQQIPPHLHLRHPNPLIPWADLSITVPSHLTPWPADRVRVAGISAFAFSGTNVHLVVSDALQTSATLPATATTSAREQHLLILTARSSNALQALARKWASGPFAGDQAVDVASLCATAATCRTVFAHRLALVVHDAVTAHATLTQFADTGTAADVQVSALAAGHPKVAFLFTGQGAQAVGMGYELYRNEPVFRAALDECDQLLRATWGHSLIELLYPANVDANTDQASLLDATANTQPALFAVEYALVQLWRSWGVQPAVVLGHSVGEYVAAWVAGVFSLADGIRLIVARARLMQALPSGGAMAAIFADNAAVTAAVAAHAGGLSVAADNGPRNTVISGPVVALETLLAQFTSQGIEYRRLPVSHAFHSALMDPMLEEFRRVAAGITYSAPRLPLITNLSGNVAGAEIASADYWVRHVRAPVRFATGVQELVRQGCGLLIELGPAAILTGMAQQNLDTHPEVICVASLRKREAASATLLSALGTYWLHGGVVNWLAVLGPPRRELHLPTYPFQHQNYWHQVAIDSARDRLHGVTVLNLPLLAYRFTSPLLHEQLFETVFSQQTLPLLEDHRVFGQLVVAGASHLSLILSAAGLLGMSTCTLRDVLFPMALVIPEAGARVVQLVVNATHEFRLVSLGEPGQEPTLHARGRIVPGASRSRQLASATNLDAIWRRCSEEVPVAAVYELQRQRHIVVGASYQWLQALRRGAGEAIARLHTPPILATTIERYSLHPGLIDSCFGAMVMTQPITVDDSFIPFAVEELHFYAPAITNAYVAHARVRRHDDTRLIGDIDLYTADGQPVATVIGLEGRRASRQALLSAAINVQPPMALYGLVWEALPPPAITPNITGHWLVLREQHPLAERIVAALRSHVTVSEALIADGIPPLADSVTGVVYLWLTSTVDNVRTAGAGALHLLQALAKRRPPASSARWPVLLVTRGARAVRAHDTIPAPHQALLWGLGQVAVAELSELTCTCLDLDAGSDSEQCGVDLLAAMAVMGREAQMAWRDGMGYVARLTPMAAPVAEFALQTARTYLITGASGALARELALWLAQHGARHLALLARRPIAAEVLAQLAQHGTRVSTYMVDVANQAQLAAVLAQIRHESAPLGAVFHLAGVLDDGMIVSQSWERWERVLAAKMHGAWNLHQLTLSDQLAVFVTFSSVAALLGNAGQSSYAAANAFLDALAWHRRARGLAALSINWGPWRALGMTAQLDEQQQDRLTSAGVYSLAVDEALAMLGRLLGGAQIGSTLAHAQIGVLALDWQRYGALHDQPLLARLIPSRNATDPTQQALRERLQQAPSDVRKTLLTDLLIDLVAESLRLPRTDIAPRERLFALGVDSLIAVELKNQLQRKLEITLSTTLLFDYPSIEALVAFLLEQLTPIGITITTSAAPLADMPVIAIDHLSEAEAEALLLAQLERLEAS